MRSGQVALGVAVVLGLAAQQWQSAQHVAALEGEAGRRTAEIEQMVDLVSQLGEKLRGAEERIGVLEEGHRRLQRTGTESSYVRIVTRNTRTVACPSAGGRFDSARCLEPEFAACHLEACSELVVVVDDDDTDDEAGGGGGGGTGDVAGGGHRRAQAGGRSKCAAEDLQRRADEVHLGCCDEPGEDCTGGTPRTCNAGCAAIFLPFWHDCSVALGEDGAEVFLPVVDLCTAAAASVAPSAPPVSQSLAVQLGVVCTDGTSATECVPDCTAELHGFLMLLNIDGEDSKLSCELHHGQFSWLGPASEGGYLGSDVEAFVSAIVSGAAGIYVAQLQEDAGVDLSLRIQPGQAVRIVSNTGASVGWGNGGLSVSQGGKLLLSQIEFDGAMTVEAGADVTLDAVSFGPFGCLTVRGNGQVHTSGSDANGTAAAAAAPPSCDGCAVIENCVTSQCTAAGIAVCAACQDGYFSMRRNDEPARCITAIVSLQIAAGLTDDAAGLYAFNFRQALPSDLASGTLTVPVHAALSLTGTGVEEISASFIIDGNSLSVERMLLLGQLSVKHRGSVSMIECVMPLRAFSALTRAVPYDGLSKGGHAITFDPIRQLSELAGGGSSLRLSGVTVADHPEWGALTGSVTVGTDPTETDYVVYHGVDYGEDYSSGRIEYDPPFLDRATGRGQFLVLSGPCTVRGDGRCVGRQDGYLGREACDIAVANGGFLAPSRLFDVGGADAVALGNSTEFRALFNTHFDVMDTNGDGEVTGAEQSHNCRYCGNGMAAGHCHGGCFTSSYPPPEMTYLAAGERIGWTSSHHGNGNADACKRMAQCSHVTPIRAHTSSLGGGWELCFL